MVDRASRPLRLGMMCEGDPETRDAWSGTVHSSVMALRKLGHTVQGMDVDLYGWRRLVGAAATMSVDRRRWSVRYRLTSVPYRLRSANARGQLAVRAGELDAVIQVGATFDAGAGLRVPVFLFCDSNIRMNEEGARLGVSESVWLEPSLREGIAARERDLYHRVQGIFTLSERARGSFLREFGVPETRVHTVHAGPNFDWSEDVLEASCAPGGPPTVLFVGRDFDRKGGPALLDAFAKVRERVPNAELVIIGPASVAGGPGIRNLGFLDKDNPTDRRRLVEAYQSSAVFCLPTRFEPLGVVFIEAMHFGLPCIGPASWAVPEMIVDGETGFLVKPDDPRELADRLITLLEDPARARRMGEAGRERARRLFTWESVARRLAQTIAGATSEVAAGVR